ncbi:MAG TPA: hypothetical protein VKU81_11550 [Casimicrobiaceae bacterium]|nr:hypothetical protein [Casimicrobiaceae bacterium]
MIALWLGWLLAWAIGVAALLALRGPSTSITRPGEFAFIVGCGWFVGQFFVTLWMRLLAIAHVPFGIVAIGAPLAALAALAAWIAWRRHGQVSLRDMKAALRVTRNVDLANEHRVLWFALLGWLALRFGLLLIEVLRRPLYPWDAWTQWATKARVWYDLRTIVPFGGESAWLAAPVGSVYYDAAPNYPGTVPLTQVWSATLLGRWDDALINLPWWLTAVAFGFALYGFLRQARMGPLAALLGTWLALSLPILDAHVALAGYADLAMSTYLTLTALSSLRFVRTRDRADLVLALVLAAACVVIKNPGKVWLLVLIPGILVAWLPRYGLRIAAACFAVAAIGALVLTRIGLTILGYHLQLEFDMPWNGLSEAYFTFANWHLLFYGALAVALLGWRHLLSRELAPLTIIVAAGVAFLVFGFAFTNARLWVEDQSTVNRATLHLAPLIVVWMLMAFREWSLAQATPNIARGTMSAAGS